MLAAVAVNPSGTVCEYYVIKELIKGFDNLILSTSGTGFAVAGARLFEDSEMLGGLLYTAEAVGSSWDANGTRRYLLAPIVGDAIMLAIKTAMPWDSRCLAKEN